MKGFFPQNAVEFYVSYYDYYQPEAYMPSTDTYIEKDLAINDEIDKLRLSAVSSFIVRQKRCYCHIFSILYIWYGRPCCHERQCNKDKKRTNS